VVQDALSDRMSSLGASTSSIWISDLSDSWVVYSAGADYYRLSYAMDTDGNVEFSGEPIAVIRRTVWDADSDDNIGKGTVSIVNKNTAPSGEKGNTMPKALPDNIKLDGLPDEVKKFLEDVMEENKQLEKDKKAAEDKAAASSTTTDPDDDDDKDNDDDTTDKDVEKALKAFAKSNPEVAAVIKGLSERAKSAEDRAQQAETVAKAERDRALREEWTNVHKEIPHTGGELEDFIKDCKTLYDNGGTEALDRMFDQLRKANAAVAGSDTFKEFGKTHNVHGAGQVADIAKTGVNELDSAVVQLRKDHPDMTFQQAINKALEAHPEWYDAYLATASA